MWPFKGNRTMNIKPVDETFSVAGQIQPEDVAEIAASGFKALICTRPDDEDPGQPSFSEIANEAEKHGLKAFHVPVSGMPTIDQIDQFRAAMEQSEAPVLGYCRSGGRASTLYGAL